MLAMSHFLLHVTGNVCYW